MSDASHFSNFMQTLPKAMKLPLLKPVEAVQNTNWSMVYDWRWLPQLPNNHNKDTEYAAIEIDGTYDNSSSSNQDDEQPQYIPSRYQQQTSSELKPQVQLFIFPALNWEAN